MSSVKCIGEKVIKICELKGASDRVDWQRYMRRMGIHRESCRDKFGGDRWSENEFGKREE